MVLEVIAKLFGTYLATKEGSQNLIFTFMPDLPQIE